MGSVGPGEGMLVRGALHALKLCVQQRVRCVCADIQITAVQMSHSDFLLIGIF